MNTKSQRVGSNVFSLAIIAAMAGLVFTGPASAADSFENAELRLEQNLTDKDVEVKFDVLTHNKGIAALQIMTPDGRVIVDFKSPSSKFGIRHLSLESPEPANDGKIQADFPEGVYRFHGTTTSGDKLQATATLSHRLPPAPQVVHPRPGQEDVQIFGATVLWNPMPDIAKYVVILEDENTGQEVSAIVSGTKNVFSIPVGFLTFGSKYKVEIGAVGRNGNRTFVEFEITTAKRP